MHHFVRSTFEWLRNVGSLVTLVSVEVALVGLVISWLQLRYVKRRDRTLDARNGWSELHKAMLEFSFRREMLNNPPGQDIGDVTLKASQAMHGLKGQLGRMPDSPLANEIAELLENNRRAEQWRANPFIEKFDAYARQVSMKAR